MASTATSSSLRSPIVLLSLVVALITPHPGAATPITFEPPIPYITDLGVYDVRLSDLDLDGDLDAVVSSPNSNSVGVWKNDGAGSFTLFGTYPAGAAVFTLADDLDADGLPDLAIANFLENTLTTRRNLGGRSFGPPEDLAIGAGPRCIAAVDWNHDGDLELAVAEFSGSQVRILDRVGSGLTYTTLREIAVAGNAKWITTGDLDGDSWSEVIVACFNTGRLTVLNSAIPGPDERTDYLSQYGCSMVVVADLNGDAYPDLAAVNEATFSTFMGTGGGALGPRTFYSLPPSSPQGIVAADYDLDGDTDLVVSIYEKSNITSIVNQGDGTFGELYAMRCGTNPRGLSTGDLDGDLIPDVAVTNYNTLGPEVGFVTMKSPIGTGPAIVTMAPVVGAPGTSVMIQGRRFLGASSVTFGGISANFAVHSDTTIQAEVPSGGRTGHVVVTTPGGSMSSSQLFHVRPDISRSAPPLAPIGTTIRVEGFNFIGATDVKFNGISAEFIVSNDDLILANVPALATTGPIQVTGPGGTDATDDSFIVGNATEYGTINLSWDDCGGAGPQVQIFDCDTNSGPPFTMVASFRPPPYVDEFLGISAVIDLASTSGGIYPDWWRFGPDECRGASTLTTSFDFTADPPTCADFYAGQAAGGNLYINPDPSAPMARLVVQAAVRFDLKGPVEPENEYYAFKVRIARSRTVGAGACERCDIPMRVELKEVQLFQPDELFYSPVLNMPGNGTIAFWQDNTPTPVLVTLVKSQAFADHTLLEWELPRGDAATLYRREGTGAWMRLGALVPYATRRAEFIDRDVRPGATYFYRVGILVGGEEVLTNETSLTVPKPVEALSLSRMAWNGSGVSASISLPAAGAAMFEIFDASGRRAFSRRLEGLKAGEQAVDFATRLAPGMYFGRLTHGEKSAGARLIVVN